MVKGSTSVIGTKYFQKYTSKIDKSKLQYPKKVIFRDLNSGPRLLAIRNSVCNIMAECTARVGDDNLASNCFKFCNALPCFVAEVVKLDTAVRNRGEKRILVD